MYPVDLFASAEKKTSIIVPSIDDGGTVTNCRRYNLPNLI